MSNQIWELVHIGFIDRLNMSKDDIKFFEDLIIRHPGDQSYAIFVETINLLKKELKNTRNEYKKMYGFYPKNSLKC